MMQGITRYIQLVVRNDEELSSGSQVHCLEADIKTRVSEGMRLELCREGKVGLLLVFCVVVAPRYGSYADLQDTGIRKYRVNGQNILRCMVLFCKAAIEI
ncbi:hypothetical protein Ccrd_001528 [Cynara cardunculus var. scolymus]|uniref:Uncharacterized protein n=1 Tax=Cynara cardunculus var. scolymus TaxID=59895 RepID=A0A118JX61_CYNCS|nr:hypothetical protein Ccrd_001528 [Cynara cardunculus var. scolymus]